MERITTGRILPDAFKGTDVQSDIWNKDITFEKGLSYLIEAASGTGKSSLCSYIYGYRCDYSGTIAFNGKDIRSLSPAEWTETRRTSLAYLFQELRLFAPLTARENVLLKNDLTGCKTGKEIDTLFETLGLADKADKRAGLLSLGQQQRVAFIRMLCQPADFFILDEPISHIDDDGAKTMTELLMAEARRSGAGIITTSIGRHSEMKYDKTFRL